MSHSQTPNTPSNYSFFTYTNLKFFTKSRRFLLLKASIKRHEPSDQNLMGNYKKGEKTEQLTEEMEDRESNNWAILQRSVKRIHFGSWEEKEVAAEEIKGLAGEGVKRRKLMAELGVIPPLVAMVGSHVVARRRVALQTLIQLANGTYTNKALMVEAGILSKLPENIAILEESTRHEFVKLVLLLSSLSNSQYPIATTKILQFVLCILESNSSINTKELCVGTLYNLSTTLDNTGTLVTNGIVDVLLRMSLLKQTSEKALASLGNLVVTVMGKKALENNPMVPESLIEILTWEEKPKCQELSAYVLMILAHQSFAQRSKMAEARIVPVLLEVALLGSPIAQKRALKLLQWFKEERHMKMVVHSGPQTGRLSIGSPLNHSMAIEGKKLMKKMVEESLYKNMETITRRANGDQGSSNLKLLFVSSSSSKSLPY